MIGGSGVSDEDGKYEIVAKANDGVSVFATLGNPTDANPMLIGRGTGDEGQTIVLKSVDDKETGSFSQP